MNEAVVAGAVAGAVAGVIASLAVVITTRSLVRRGMPWELRASAVRQYTAQPASGGGPAWTPAIGHEQARRGPRPLDPLNDSGRRVLGVAQAEAIALHHNYIGTEHLLLGVIVADAEGPAGRALAKRGITLDKVRTALRFIVGPGDTAVTPTELTLSPRTRMVLELAGLEAQGFGHAAAGAVEILLGLIREGEGIASGIIESLGSTLDELRQAVLEELQTRMAMPPAERRRGPFDHLTDRAKRVIALSQDEAIRFNHNYIGPEHVLLGIIREGEGVGARVLASLGAHLDGARREVENLIGRGESGTSPSEITLTPRTKKLIELAIDEARILGRDSVASEHLLLGVLRDPGSNAGTVLTKLGVDLEKIRPYVAAMLGEGGPPPRA